MRKWTLFGILCLSLATTALAETQEYAPCTRELLEGNWTLVKQTIQTQVSPGDPFFYPHQRFTFSQGGTLILNASTQPMDKGGDDILNIPHTFEMTNPGILLTSRKDKPDHKNQAICAYMTSDSPNPSKESPQKGDVLLSYYQANDKPPFAQKLLRKI